MAANSITKSSPKLGRVSSRFLSDLRKRILTGSYPAGCYLPTVRDMSQSKGLARKTVNGVLKELELEGLVAAEPRKGYRVLSRATDPDLGCPLAYVADLTGTPDSWKPLHQELLSAFQGEATKRSWTLMGVGSQGRDRETIMRQLVTAKVSGLIIDAVAPDVLDAIRRFGLPAVVVDCGEENLPIDSIVQDSHHGGVLAATHLAERGHERIAWFGPTNWSAHSRARVGGTLAGLIAKSHLLNSETVVEATQANAYEKAQELLARSDRPTGIVSLFQDSALPLVRAARDAGLVLGKDIDVVGWFTEDQYRRDWLPLFGDGPAAPAIVWRPRVMAELAVDRLEARRKNPGLTPVKICVPVELRLSDEL